MKATVWTVALGLMRMKLKQILLTRLVELQLTVSTMPLEAILALATRSSNELLGQVLDLEQIQNPLRKTASLESISFQGSRNGMTQVQDLSCSSDTKKLGQTLQVNAIMSSLISARKWKLSLVQLASRLSSRTRKVRLFLFWLFKYFMENKKLGEQLDSKSLTEMATEGALRNGIGRTQLQEYKSSSAKAMLGGLVEPDKPRLIWPAQISEARCELGQIGS